MAKSLLTKATPILISCLLFLQGCGYVSDKPLKDLNTFESDELKTCKIDLSKLDRIFIEDQAQAIRCIQENLIQYTKYVRSQNGQDSNGSINESDINEFVRKFFEGKSETIIKGLSIIFQLNMILLRDEANRISRNNINPLFDLLVQANREAIHITDALRQMREQDNRRNFWEIRTQFISSVVRFSQSTLAIIRKNPRMPKALNIKDFLMDISRKLGVKKANGETGLLIDEETIDSFIFLKSLLVGGDKNIVTSSELEELISNLPKLLGLSFDFFYVTSDNFENVTQESKFYLERMYELNSIIKYNQPNFVLFTNTNVITIAKKVFKDKNINIDKFAPTIKTLKLRLIGGTPEEYTLIDLKNFLTQIQGLAETVYFNNVTYDAYRSVLNGDAAIKSMPRLYLDDYKIFASKKVDVLHEDFKNIALLFKYYREKETGMQYYGTNFRRSKYGFMEMGILRWLCTKLVTAYGHPMAEKPDVYNVNLAEFETFLVDLKPILEELRLWSPNFKTFARNAVLLADLFQHQSDGSGEVSLNESAEYVSMILSAVNITEKFVDSMNKTGLCDPGADKEDPKYEVACYRKHFFDVLMNQLNYKSYFPMLQKYLQSTPEAEIQRFLIGVEGFARDIPDPKIPMNKRDLTLLLGAMINIETTFLRFDRNNDNIIDNAELDSAFEVYEEAIFSIARLKPDQRKYTKSIFLYMVKNMEIPKTGSWLDSVKFMYFHMWESRKTIHAKRLNIGTLLFYLVVQADQAKRNALKNLRPDELIFKLDFDDRP